MLSLAFLLLAAASLTVFALSQPKEGYADYYEIPNRYARSKTTFVPLKAVRVITFLVMMGAIYTSAMVGYYTLMENLY